MTGVQTCALPISEFDAFVADENSRARDEFTDFMLALAAERAIESILGVATAGFAHDRPVPRTLAAQLMLRGAFITRPSTMMSSSPSRTSF